VAKLKLTQSANRARAAAMYERLHAMYPDVHCTLDYKSPFQLLVMTALAAQCTDARVNIVSKVLFKQYPTPQHFLDAAIEDIEASIKSCGFYRNKAKNIKACSRLLVEEYGGEVPDTMEDLTRLAGVGRKTANVILGECFGKQGVIVDTHCTRLTRRWGFTKNVDAVKIERDLMKVWPEHTWTLFSHFTVFHGRAVCTARGPKCSACGIRDLCPFPDTREGKKIAK